MNLEKHRVPPPPEQNTILREITVCKEDAARITDTLDALADTILENPLKKPVEIITSCEIPVQSTFALALNAEPDDRVRQILVIPKGKVTTQYHETKEGNEFSLTTHPDNGPGCRFSPFVTPSGDYLWLMQNMQGQNVGVFGKTEFAIVLSEIVKRSRGERGERYTNSHDTTNPYHLNILLSMASETAATATTRDRTYYHEEDSGTDDTNTRSSLQIVDSPDKRWLALTVVEPLLRVSTQDGQAQNPSEKFIGRSTAFISTTRNAPVPLQTLKVTTRLRGDVDVLPHPEIAISIGSRDVVTDLATYVRAMTES